MGPKLKLEYNTSFISICEQFVQKINLNLLIHVCCHFKGNFFGPKVRLETRFFWILRPKPDPKILMKATMYFPQLILGVELCFYHHVD